MARDQEWDIKLDGVGLILDNDGLAVRRVQANPFAMKSSAGERSYADLDEWAVFQCDTTHRGMGLERYGDPSQFYSGIHVDTRFKNKVILAPQTYQTTLPTNTGQGMFARFGSKLFLACDNDIYELAGSTWTLRESLTAACTGMAEFNGWFYAAQGISNTMRKTADGTTWADVVGTPAAYRLYVHGGYLYRSLNQVLYYSNDPEASPPTWSSAIYVDDSQYIVESMVTFQNGLIVFKNNGGWRVPGNPGEDDKAYPIGELQWEDAVDSGNGKYCTVWSDGFLYVTMGKGGLLRWTGKTVSSVGVDRLQGESKVLGRYWGLVATANFLYALVGTEGDQDCAVQAWNGVGWHPLVHYGNEARALYYFDTSTVIGGNLYTMLYNSGVGENAVYNIYQPGESTDPTTAEDVDYLFTTAAITSHYVITPKFTANMHDNNKEFRRLTIWADNWGLSGTGTQQIRAEYRVDQETTWHILDTLTITGNTQRYKADFPTATFADKTFASLSTLRIVLATGSTADMSVGDWVYFAGSNEYRQVTVIVDSTTFDIHAQLDTTPAAGTYIRPGFPWGRWIQFRFSFYSSVSTRTPVMKAWALKYLVNVEDYDVWQASVRVACPRAKRNGQEDRTPVGDQLSRLNEIRRKGRVEFYDEVNESHTVKVSNYSLVPVRQRTDGDEAKAEYTARLTLLEV